MQNWAESMEQTFEYYTVDPKTWKNVKKIDTITASTINYDSSTETLGSATIDIIEPIDECYVRIYLVTIQEGIEEKFPLGTFMVQSPSSNFDGKVSSGTMDAYTPLIELKENQPPFGYSILKDANIMDNAYRIIRENARAPIVGTDCDKTLFDDFVSNTNDTWISFIYDLISKAKYKLGLDELSRIIFLPNQELSALQPVWTYNDDNSSILLPDVKVDRDIFDIPNIVEVIYSSNTAVYYAKVINDDPDSPTSTVSRGRDKVYRVINPSFVGDPTQSQIDEYAEQLLRDLSTVEYTITYTHGYCPVRTNDCVRLNYKRAKLNNVKAKVISQSIKCVPGCQVSEKAVFTSKLWR